MRLAWSTDIHLNLLRFPDAPAMFAGYVQRETQCDALLVTGDISSGLVLANHLDQLEKGLGRPLYFVLGNHDYYMGSFETSQKIANAFEGHLEGKVVELTESIGLVGQGGWYDALLGKPYEPKFGMNDWNDIAELANLPGNPFYNHRLKNIDRAARTTIIEYSQARSAAQAAAAEVTLTKALERFEQVVFATHVPPFEGATWHEGATSDPMWLPWFSSKLMGEMLLRIMVDRTDRRMLVLCGHTHSSGIHRPLPNLTVLTGEAHYHTPNVAGVLMLEGSSLKVEMKSMGGWGSVDLYPV
jgi:Icc protein